MIGSTFKEITIKDALKIFNGEEPTATRSETAQMSKHQKTTYRRMKNTAARGKDYFKEEDEATKEEYLNYMFTCFYTMEALNRKNLTKIYFMLRKEDKAKC